MGAFGAFSVRVSEEYNSPTVEIYEIEVESGIAHSLPVMKNEELEIEVPNH